MTSELSLLQLLAFQANLVWPWQVAGDMLGLGGLALVLWGGARLLFVAQAPRSSPVFGRRAGPAAWVGFAFAGYALFGHAPVAAPGCLHSAARVRWNGGGAWT